MGAFTKNVIILLSLVLFTGCTGFNPYPLAARAGDTISIPVGSQDGMDKTNTTITYTSDSDGIPIDMTANIRAIFNLYSDKGSYSYSSSTKDNDDNFRYMHHEPWQTVLVADLPTTLPVGTGHVNVNTTAPQPFYALEPGYIGTYPELSAVDMSLEILAGTGISNQFKYKTVFGGTLDSKLSDLEPGAGQAIIRPPIEDPAGQWTATYGAIEIKMNMPMTQAGTQVPLGERSIRIITQDVSMFTDSKAHSTWTFNGSDFTIIYLSVVGNMYYYEPRFQVMSEYATFDSTPIITSVKYFDLNGNEITGPAITDYSVGML